MTERPRSFIYMYTFDYSILHPGSIPMGGGIKMTDTALAFLFTGGLAVLLFVVCLLYKMHMEHGTYTTDLHQCEHCRNAVFCARNVICIVSEQRIFIKLRKCPDYAGRKRKKARDKGVPAAALR